MTPLTDTRSKVMLPVAGRPVIEHLVSSLIQAGIKDIVLVAGFHSLQVGNYLRDGRQWGARITYCRQNIPLGTGDALLRASPLVGDTFMVVNGDTLYRVEDIVKILNSKIPALGVIQVDDPCEMGVITRQGDRVTGIVEKSSAPPSDIANCGIYLLNKNIFPAILSLEKSLRGEYEITAAIQALIEQGVHFRFHELSDWLTFSYPWDLLDGVNWFYQAFRGGILGTVEEGVTLKGEVSVGGGSIIRSGCYISGPVIIGRNCDIGPNCYLRAGTSIGDDCHIGANVEIKNSVIMNGTKVPHLAYIGDSIIGENCNLGAGTKIANLRFDKQNIKSGGRDSGRQKLGAILGDGVLTGINTSIDAGTMIGAGSYIGPGVFVKGSIKPGSRLFESCR